MLFFFETRSYFVGLAMELAIHTRLDSNSDPSATASWVLGLKVYLPSNVAKVSDFKADQLSG